jgi:hypothetical protein
MNRTRWQQLQELMHASIDTDECVLWPGPKDKDGYGCSIRIGKYGHGSRQVRPHVKVCEAVWGPKPSPVHEVRHTCNQPACVSIKHIEWATHRENILDRSIAENTWTTKLTAVQVRAIRLDPRPHTEVARQYGVHPSTILRARNGESWTHLT